MSFDIPGQAGGAQISGSNEADRFIMGLLRASTDAVIVGASTVDAVSPAHLWIAEHVYPAATDAYAHYRQKILKKPAHPLSFPYERHPDADRYIGIWERTVASSGGG